VGAALAAICVRSRLKSLPHNKAARPQRRFPSGLTRASCPRPCGPPPTASSKIAPGDFVDAFARTTSLRASARTLAIPFGTRLVSGQMRQKRGSWILLRPLLKSLTDPRCPAELRSVHSMQEVPIFWAMTYR
jgi:hypothetical protein